MATDVKLKIGGDTTEFERALISSMRKIQSEADKLKIAPATKAAAGAPGSQSFQQAFQSARAQQQKTRDEKDGLDIAVRGLTQKQRELDKIVKLEAAAVGNEKQKAYWANERNKAEREYNTLLATRSRLEGRPGGGGFGGGGSGIRPPTPSGGMFGNIPKGGITSLSGLGNAAGIPMAGIATAIAGMIAGESARVFFSQTANRARATEASAFNMQGQGGQRLEAFMTGGASEEMMFNPQRMQAAQIAQQTFQNNLNSPFRAIGHKKEWFNAVTGGMFGLDAEVAADQRSEQSAIQAEQFNAIKNGPEGKLRTTVGEKYLRDWQRNLGFQRQMGQGEEGFRGFLGGVNSAGFADEQGMGMASGIMGAGGSTRASTGNAAFALQMQRQFGLTNAGQAIGSISGQLGSSELSKDALIKIQSEGTRIGLNQSDFREENRKFVEMAANVINQSNVTSGAGVEQLVGTLGKFMGSNTISGLEAGKNAYQAYQQQSNVQSGPSAAMRAAGMMKSPILSKLTGEDQASLFTMNQADVNVDNLGIQAMARKAGVSAKDFVNAYHGVQDSSLFNRKSTDMAISKLSDAYKTGKGIPEAEGEALNLMRLEPAAQGLDEKGKMELARARAKGDTGTASKLLEEGIRTAAATGATGRPGDDMERQQAEASRLANGLFKSFQDSIIPASTAVVNFAGAIDTLLKAMNGTATQRAAALERFNSSYPGMTPSTQSTAGPPANGSGSNQANMSGGAPRTSIGSHF